MSPFIKNYSSHPPAVQLQRLAAEDEHYVMRADGWRDQ